jgi:hypothetical protein
MCALHQRPIRLRKHVYARADSARRFKQSGGGRDLRMQALEDYSEVESVLMGTEG